jgi:nucleotide-binding universal stress UspA family protein
MLPVRTILHPTDFSERSRYAFALASGLARDHGARLVVLHVAPAPVVVYGEGVLPVDTDALVLEARHKIKTIQAPDPTVRLEYRVLAGPEPVSEILRVAKEESCDLIVMGTHGRTGLRRVLMGSVAELVVRKAPCPVLTVKMPFAPAQAAAAAAASPAGQPAEAARP